MTGGTLNVGLRGHGQPGSRADHLHRQHDHQREQWRTDHATVQGTAVAASVSLTVAQARVVHLALGTGNEIDEPNPAQYSVPYAVQVTDAERQRCCQYADSRSVRVSVAYGNRTVHASGRAVMVAAVYEATVIDEDFCWAIPRGPRISTATVSLDPGEDFNTNGRLEAGNIATVRPTGGTGTDRMRTGSLEIEVVYPQEYAYWVKVESERARSRAGHGVGCAPRSSGCRVRRSDFNTSTMRRLAWTG